MTIIRSVWQDLRLNFKALLFFHLYFAVLSAAVLVPLSAWTLKHLIGISARKAISNTEILTFLLSFKGILWLIGVGVFGAALLFTEHAGMMLITWQGKRATALTALRRVLSNYPLLFRLGARYITTHLLFLSPFLAAGGLTYVLLLSSYDIYYLVTERPPVWWIALSIAALLAVGVLMVNGGLYLRWIFSLPALIIGRLSPPLAIKRSVSLVKGARWRIAVVAISFAAAVAVLPAMITLLFDQLGKLVFLLLPETPGLVIPVVLLIMGLYLLLSFMGSTVAVAANSIVIVHLYSSVSGDVLTEEPFEAPRPTRFPFIKEILLLIVALVFSAITLKGFDIEDRVLITAHRGSSLEAPENSLSAIQQAINDGADFAEIDVQETADGKVVLLHDKDLLRIAGLKKNIWEVKYQEIKDLDAGSWFDPRFNDERIPLLREAMDLARDRIKLNIELKFNGHDQRLAERVVEIIEEEEFASRCIITSLEFKGLETVQSLNPEIHTGYIVFDSIGRIANLNVKFLSLSARIADLDLINEAHAKGKEVHVWTVNKEADMSKFIDFGADNLITDRPAAAKELLETRKTLSKNELLLLKVRSWLWN